MPSNQYLCNHFAFVIVIRGQLHFHRIYAMVPYMETDKDKGGSCKRFMDLPQICYESPTEHYGDPRTGLRMKEQHKGLVFRLFFLSANTFRVNP